MTRKLFNPATLASFLTPLLLINLQSFGQSPLHLGPAPVVDTALNSGLAPNHSRLESIRITSDLVLVRDNFTVYEGNQPQQIRYFSNEDSPISVGLILDVSSSMQDKIDTERAAVEQFFNNANPEDDYFAITFNNQPRILSDVARSITGIETELGLVKPSGSTALLDAVYLGLSKLRDAHYSRRALVIISDGGDNSSRYKLREIKSLIAESDVMVYAIGIFGTSPFKSFEEAMGGRWLSSMTDVTGGKTTTIQDVSRLPEECASLSRELRNQYVLGYRPNDRAADGKWRKIKINVSRPSDTDQLRSYYRRGYYATIP